MSDDYPYFELFSQSGLFSHFYFPNQAQHCPDPLFTKEENVKNLRQMLNEDTRGDRLISDLCHKSFSALVVINFEIYNALKWEMLHKVCIFFLRIGKRDYKTLSVTVF